MNRVARRAGITLLLVLMLTVGLVFFLMEYMIQAGNWVVFPGSPHVYSGGNIGCGTVIDRDDVLLLDLNDGRRYSDNDTLRQATVHWIGDRHGSVDAPALSNYASQLAGYDLLGGVYSYGDNGGVAQLTLSAVAQEAALKALGSYKGTVGIYNYKTGELICAVTTPTYDPDNVPDESDALDGMYVNRFTQSCYTPGSIMKIVTLAAALETIPDIQEQKFMCRGSYTIGSDEITCEDSHWEQDLKSAFRNSCNCAFAQISQQLSGKTLQRYAEQFGITDEISFDGIQTAKGNFDVADTDELSVAWASIGQFTDQINPCAYMTFMGAIAADGKGVEPYLVERITVDGIKTHSSKNQKRDRIMSKSTAKILQEYLAFNVSDKYGSENFPGLTVCAKTGTGEVGGGKKPNAMFTGFVADEEYPLAFIVAVEDGGYGRQVCMPILSKVLAACKAAMDAENG